MKVSTENTENRQAILNVEAEPEEMKESLDVAYKELKKKVSVPGFRRGKTPRSILENYIGKEELQKEALEYLVPELCNKAMEEQKIDAIGQPRVEIVQIDPVIFKATYPLRPQVELGDYHKISLAPEPVEVTEEQVNSTIERLQEQYATWSPAERPLNLGDMAIIDIEQLENGEVVNSYQGQQMPVTEGSMMPLPGFAEQLVGMASGEEKEFPLEFAEDYGIEQLKGQKYYFKVKLTEVKEKQLPEVNDDFARNFGSGMETVAALRENIAASLKNIAEEGARRAFEQQVIEAAVETSKVEFPPLLEEQEIERYLGERDRMLQQQGGLDAYLKNINKTEAEIREEVRPEAAKEVTKSLVLGKVAAEEKLEISEEEIHTEIENMLKSSPEQAEEMKKVLETPRGHAWVEERLIINKTVQLLSKIATDNAAAGSGDTAEETVDAVAETGGDADKTGDAALESGDAAEESKNIAGEESVPADENSDTAGEAGDTTGEEG